MRKAAAIAMIFLTLALPLSAQAEERYGYFRRADKDSPWETFANWIRKPFTKEKALPSPYYRPRNQGK